MGFSFNEQKAAPIDSPSLSSFITKYENQGVVPNQPAINNFSKPVIQTVNTNYQAAAIGQSPPYAPLTAIPESISVETASAGVNNVKGFTAVADKEKTLAVMKDA
jgi:hypothetical protein